MLYHPAQFGVSAKQGFIEPGEGSFLRSLISTFGHVNHIARGSDHFLKVR